MSVRWSQSIVSLCGSFVLLLIPLNLSHDAKVVVCSEGLHRVGFLKDWLMRRIFRNEDSYNNVVSGSITVGVDRLFK